MLEDTGVGAAAVLGSSQPAQVRRIVDAVEARVGRLGAREARVGKRSLERRSHVRARPDGALTRAIRCQLPAVLAPLACAAVAPWEAGLAPQQVARLPDRAVDRLGRAPGHGNLM